MAVIQIGSRRAVLGTAAGRWQRGSAEQRIELYRDFVIRFLATRQDEAPDGLNPLLPAVLAMQLTVLMGAVTDNPVPLASLLPADEAKGTPAASNGRRLDELLQGYAAENVRRRLERLAGLGLVTGDTHSRVPTVIARCLAAALEAIVEGFHLED